MEIKCSFKDKVFGAEAIFDILSRVLKAECEVDRAKEHFWAIGLDSSNRIEYIELVSLGLLDQALVHHREVYRFAVMKGIAKLLVCHNHPSNGLEFSKTDISITEQLKKAGDIIGIKLLDHILITDNEYQSMRERGEM